MENHYHGNDIDTMQSLGSQFRSSLIAGILAFAPLALTLWGLIFLVNLSDRLIEFLPKKIQPEELLGFPIPGLGIVLTLIVLLIVGTATRNYAGMRIVDWYERLLQRVPIISSVYIGLKQLFETLFSERDKSFSQVVLVEYPRQGVYSLAFLINTESPLLEKPGLISIFLPTTPNPTSGFFLMVPRSEIQILDISIEEAFKMIMSAGLVPPAPISFRHLDEANISEGTETIIPND